MSYATLYRSIYRAISKSLMSYIFIILALLVSHIACDPENTQSASNMSGIDDEKKVELLQSLVSNVYAPISNQMLTSHQELVIVLEQLAGAPSDDLINQAQEAWRASMRIWHQLEMMQVGPAGMSTTRVGGEDLRDMIYSFPVNNNCRVDQELIRLEWQKADWMAQADFNVRGYDAIEHLLFDDAMMNACPQQASINRDQVWQAFLDETTDVVKVRFEYALVLAQDITTQLERLQTVWNGDFAQAFRTANSPYRSKQEVYDQIFASLFYMDQWVKDLKLGASLGMTDDCTQAPCIDLLEHGSSQFDKEALISNLEGFLWVLQAKVDHQSETTEVMSFIQLLEEQGASELAKDLVSKTQSCIESLNMISSPLSTQLKTDSSVVQNIHQQVRDITDLLKGPFVSILNLSIPQEGAGDND